MEAALFKWVIDRKKNKFDVNYKDLRNKAKELCNDSNFSASSGWVRNFRKRHNVTRRVPTHISKSY